MHGSDVVVAEAIGEKDHYRWVETLSDEAQVRANARLIAAAPELVTALDAISDAALATDWERFTQALVAGESLLARIRGEEQHSG